MATITDSGSGSIIIVDDSSVQWEYQKGTIDYNTDSTSDMIFITRTGDKLRLLHQFDRSDISDPATANIGDLRTALRSFFFNSGSGGSGTGWNGVVTNFAALPAATGSGDVYLVQNSTGILWGKRKGLYEDTGTWNRLSNVTFKVNDAEALFVDDVDNTKAFQYQISGITTATTRTYTVPDKNGTIAMLSDTSGKTIVSNPTTPYTTTNNDVILWDATLVEKTVDLPSAASSSGFIIDIKNTGTNKKIIVDGNGDDVEDSATIQVKKNKSVTIVCDGVEWFII